MPIKYFGKSTEFCGKTLWEIVGNLKNFGVGRLVYRHTFQRYPEPTYMRILRVQPVYHDGNNSNPHQNLRKTIVYVENVFRGRRDPEVKEINLRSFHPDYRLVPKHEQQDWIKRTDMVQPKIQYIDPYIDFPPLLKKIVEQELRSKNEEVTAEKLKLKLCFRADRNNTAREADADHPADVKLESYFGIPVSPEMYEIKEEVREHFTTKAPY